MDTLVTTDWLYRHLGDPDLVLLDCSVTTQQLESGGIQNVSGRENYEQGHIPGAVFADLKGDLCDVDSPIEFAIPSPEQFCTAMGALGVGDRSRVVLYDSSFSAWAARVWWMLRWVGFDRAAILNGGLRLWRDEQRPLSNETVNRPVQQLIPGTRPELIADHDEVLAGIDDETVHLVDTMPEAHYHGDMVMYGRPGHIPGAVNISGVNLIDESGRYRPDAELAQMHTGDHNARTITYCGGGILASSSAFVMSRLGFKNVAVYTASLQEWASDPDNPLVVDNS